MKNEKPLSQRYQTMIQIMRKYCGEERARYAEKIVREGNRRRWDSYDSLFRETQRRYNQTKQGKREIRRMTRELNQKDLEILACDKQV